MIGRTISHYKLLQRLGGGGMGVVYRAEDLRLGRIVALKFLNPEIVSDENTRKRFLHEAQAASSLDHPNICQIFEVDETDEGRLFMSMAYYGGSSLRDRLADAPLDVREAFQIAYSVAQGLACAHRRGITHRDIKPANVMITDEGYVKIVDFGLAKLAGRSRITQSGTTLGTVAYMSPEQARDEEVDERTDIWALGVMLYEMVTGRLPFRGQIDQAMIYSILNEDHPGAREVNPSVPEECARIIDRCLEKDVARRYASAEEFLGDVIALAEPLGWDSSIAAATIPPVTRIRRRRRRMRRALIGGAVAVVAIGAGYLWWQSAHRAPSPFTTHSRVAVLPLDNLVNRDLDPFCLGLAHALADLAIETSIATPSMWVVPARTVMSARLADPSAARFAFGVNRIVTGNLQRYQNLLRLNLRLLDATTVKPLQSVAIDFDYDAPTDLRAALVDAIARFFDTEPLGPGVVDRVLPSNALAMSEWFEGSGFLLSDERGLDSAVVDLRAAALLDTGSAAVLAQLGEALWRTSRSGRNEGRIAEARLALERARRAGAHCDYPLGRVWEALGRPDSAVACYQRALAVCPWDAIAAWRLGRTLRSLDRYDEAEAVLERAARASPDFFMSQRELGRFFYSTQQSDRAIPILTRAAELAPTDVITLDMLGAIHYGRGEWTQAREMFERSFRLNPKCASCSNLGLVLYFERRFGESAAYYEQALEYCDTTADTWANQARVLYWVKGEEDATRRLFRRAIASARATLARDPENVEAMSTLLESYAMIEQPDSALRVIAMAEPFAERDADLAYRIAATYEVLGDRNKALHHIGEAVRHGFPRTVIEGTPELDDLVKDVRYRTFVDDDSSSVRSTSSR